MLHRDYILEMIAQFCEAVTRALRHALEGGGIQSCVEVETEVATLLDLDPMLALSLEPDSLVSMMVLSGLGSSVAEHVAYALSELSDVYDDLGEEDLSKLRLAQAAAVAESFGCDLDAVPEGFRQSESDFA